MKWIGRNTHIPLKSQIFITRNWNELKEMKLDLMTFFTKIPKIPLYIQSFILKYGSNNNIVI